MISARLPWAQAGMRWPHSACEGTTTCGGSSQQRQRPRSAIQLKIGMFSNQLIRCPQRVQRDGGRTTDISCGHRTMQTLRNEPTMAPRRNAADNQTEEGVTGGGRAGGCRRLPPR